jgi:hypothetical protein
LICRCLISAPARRSKLADANDAPANTANLVRTGTSFAAQRNESVVLVTRSSCLITRPSTIHFNAEDSPVKTLSTARLKTLKSEHANFVLINQECGSSTKAAEKLDDAGFNVADFEGGAKA